MQISLVEQYITPLIQMNLFSNEEEAVKELVKAYILKKTSDLTSFITSMEEKYKMNLVQFKNFVKEESNQIIKNPKNTKLSSVFIEHEEDLFEWNSKHEILESWLLLKKGKL